MIDVYAITEAAAPEPPDAGLERVVSGELAGVFARMSEVPEQISPEALWRHERLVEALMAQGPVLPLRYGTVLDDEPALERVIAERSEEFSRLLETVRGRVELALRVLAEQGPPAPAGEAASGREYMEALAARRRRADDAAAALEPLAAVAEAARKGEAGGDDLARWAFLIDRDRLPEFNSTLEELREAHPELRLTCTGPWPPYSFVSGGGQ